MYQPLFDHIRKFVSLSEQDAAILTEHLSIQKLSKKELLLEQGRICRSNHFILKGCCYLFMTNETGYEQVIQFGIENWWITDYGSLDLQKPSKFNIRAAENTWVAVLEKKHEEALFAKLPQLEKYFRVILQRAYAATLQRIQFIFSMSGEERYLHFKNMNPTFLQRIPQYVLASYLGFTPEFLSKIRAKKS